MKRLLAVVLFLISFSLAQEPAPTFRSDANLVLVPVVVTRDGNAVTALKSSDFILLRDGKPESISLFEEITVAGAPQREPISGEHVATNFGRGDKRSDTVILLLDFLNAEWQNAAAMRAYVRNFAEQFSASNTPVSVLLLTPKGLVQAHSFTADPATLLKAVDTWAKKPRTDPLRPELSYDLGWSSTYDVTSMDGTAAIFNELALPPNFAEQRKLDRAAMTTQALEQISAAFGGLPGRKRLIWLSTGFPNVADIDSYDGVSAERAGNTFKVADKIRRAWQALTASNIVVYPIDSNGGPVTPGWGRQVPNTASMLEVAKRTGGKTCVDLLNNCLERTLASDKHYYLLGFYLRGEKTPGWHKLKVELKDQKADIRTRTGFAIGDLKPDTKEIDRDIVMTALASPLDYTSVPLTLEWTNAPPKGDQRQIELHITSAPGAIFVAGDTGELNLNFLAFVRTHGKTDGEAYPATLVAKLAPAQQQSLAKSGFSYRKVIPVKPGEYEIKVFLRDNNAHKIGTVSTIVNIK